VCVCVCVGVYKLNISLVYPYIDSESLPKIVLQFNKFYFYFCHTRTHTHTHTSRGLGRRIHGSVEDTKLSTNKQHTLSHTCMHACIHTYIQAHIHACMHIRAYIRIYIHGERYFLLVIDKGTEYLANFNTKTRQSPVALLQAYITELPPLAKPRDSFAWTGKRNLYPTKW
jgi:hypothetical protein